MGKTDPDAARHRQQSMILVPRDTPGVTIVRPLTVFGYDDRDHGGHAEIAFDGRPRACGEPHRRRGRRLRDRAGAARTGPHPSLHARAGMAERALSLVRERALHRVAFGRTLAEQGVLREWVAESRIQLESLRLLVLKTAWLMDTVGNRAAMTEIQAIKIAVPRAVQQILDRAIQVFGGAGPVGGLPARRDVRRRAVAAAGRRSRRSAPERPRQGRVRPLRRLRERSGCRLPRRSRRSDR